MADDPIIQRARETKFYQDGLRELGRNLPSQDEELDRVLTQAVETKDDRAFTHLILAALAVGRKVDAHHLIEGAILFPGLRPFAAAALHCSGNVAQALLEAVARGGFLPRTEAGVLAVAMVWCEDHPAEPIPRELITRARMRAREVGPEQLPAIELLSISKRCRDEALQSILEKAGQGGYQQIADEILDSLFTESRASPLAPVPAQPEAVAISGYTVRRSAPRIGRNDLCPCGSGKKYKKCCYDKDQERLRHPSAVPGLTVDEWRTVPELGLTEARLSQMRPFELSRLDPLKIPEKLRWPFLDQLVMSDQVEAAVVAFEKFGYRPNYQLPWRFGLRLATRAGRRDLVERLFRVRTDDQTEEDFSLSARLLLASESDNQLLQMVEKEARAAIQAESTAPLAELAYSMLDSQAPSLGILVARSVLPIVPELEAITIFDAVLKTRDRLDLPPDDPFDQILDARLLGPVDETAATSQELKHARAGLEAKNEEVRKLAQELERLKRALEPGEAPKPKHAEAKSPPSPVSLPTPTPTPALDERSLAQMRQRMNSLRDMLKERHMERNQLRRELQAAQAQIQALHDKPSESPTALSGAVPSPEDEFLVPSDEEFSSQPVRIPEFPRKFQNTLAALPKPIARACLGLIGRMAGGEAAAFGGSKRLKTAPEIHRQRLAGDYRLLFRLHSDRFEVIDLIHRRDLERKIKSLT